MANGLQVKQAILEMPENLEGNKSSHSTTLKNIETYKVQSTSVFPYQEELLTKSVRLDEVSKIILAKLAGEQKIQNSEIKFLKEPNQNAEVNNSLNKHFMKV